MKIVVYGKPMGKQRPRVTNKGGYAAAYTPQETVSYENLVKITYVEQAGLEQKECFCKPLNVSITAYYSIPLSFSRRRHDAAMNGILRPQIKPDIDNVVKIICDALNGIAYRDDSQIVSLSAQKYYSDEPRVVIKIEEQKQDE